jgi:outer membrane protein TolC
MSRRERLLLVLPLVAASLATRPETGLAQITGDELTLGQAVGMALRHHPTALRGREAVRSAEAGLGEVQATRWPTLFGSGGIVAFQLPMLVAPIHTFNPDSLRADPPQFERTLISSQWTLEYLLWDGGGREARVAGAEANLKAADLSREALDAIVIERVTAQYLQVRAARELEAAHLERISALEAELDRVARAIQEGTAAEVERLRAQATLSEALADLESARAETFRATRELARSMGVADTEIARRDLRDIPLPDDPEAGVSPVMNPDLLAAEQRVEAARLAADATGSTWWPELIGSAQLNQYGSTNGFFSTEWNVGLSFRYPIWSGGFRKKSNERARADLRQSEEQLRETELQVESLVDQAESRWDEATARLDALRDAVRLMEEVARVERLALEEGVGLQRDLLDAEADLLRARASLIQAEGTAVLARVSLARARGTLTSDWLEHHLENTP